MSVRPGPFEYPVWMPRRPGAAVAAIALNAALGAALILCFRIPAPLESRDTAARLIWFSEPDSRPEPTEPRRSKPPRSMASRAREKAPALSPIVPSAAPMAVTPAPAPIDWWKEAERVVNERARAASVHPDSGTIDLHTGTRADAPAHHAGESYRDEFGDRVVWVSEKCYIESDPPLPGTPPAFASARLARTVCTGDSKAPDGELFKDLPAYRKHHPEH